MREMGTSGKNSSWIFENQLLRLQTVEIGADMRDHPVIECMERTGWPDGHDPMPYICPSCGAELAREESVLVVFGEYVGCASCVYAMEAQEYFE